MKNKGQNSRREFIKQASVGAGIVGLSAMGFSAKSYARIIGANDRVRVGIVGFSNRFKSSLFPCFMEHAKTQNFEFVAVSDLWNRRRDEAYAYVKEKAGVEIAKYRNND
ncbi:MAG TPA: twin-arginine translocation signal domain-containing protein, partial [Parapedobacter sp.]|nr:twin-arginine translocation signal domain-containing protein [Parapedobacter sp.]